MKRPLLKGRPGMTATTGDGGPARRPRLRYIVLVLAAVLGLVVAGVAVATRTAQDVTSSLWTSSAVPADSADNGNPVELGIRFRATAAGSVTGIRFYKAPGNTGVHTGSLWTATGEKLASVTFANETATGWQEAAFPKPVDVVVGETYVASYFAPQGHYVVDYPYFDLGPEASRPLVAPAATPNTPNGLYTFSETSVFPREGFGANYWVDVAFRSTERAVRVMALGDSITQGVGASGGYRTRLWARLVASGRDRLDFVGSERSGPEALGDIDHEGHIGWTTDQILERVDGWVQGEQPDIILLHIGTNNLNQGATAEEAGAELRELLGRIFLDSPDVQVVVARIIPLLTEHSAQWANYNSEVSSVAEEYRKNGKAISVVDMADALNTAADYEDTLHPNQSGYDKMADEWYPSVAAAYDSVVKGRGDAAGPGL